MGFAGLTQFMTNALGSTVYLVPGGIVGPKLLITDVRAIAIKARWTTKNPHAYDVGSTNKINSGDNSLMPEDRWLEISANVYTAMDKSHRIIDQNGDNYSVANIRLEYGAGTLAKTYVTCHPLYTINTIDQQ